jgi:hypothetical protein
VGARFSAPAQTGPGAHPASCTMGTGSFLGVKSGQGVTLTPHPLLCRGHERVELYFYSPYGPYGLYRASVQCALPALQPSGSRIQEALPLLCFSGYQICCGIAMKKPEGCGADGHRAACCENGSLLEGLAFYNQCHLRLSCSLLRKFGFQFETCLI